MTEIAVVPAIESDAEGIRNVQRDTWLATYPNEQYGITKEDVLSKDWDKPARIERWREIILQDPSERITWVAKDGERIVGFCCAWRSDTGNQLKSIYLLPEYQGKKVGAKLIETALEWINPLSDTSVEVAKYNTNAINFYKRYGFEGEEDIPSQPGCELPSGKAIPEIRMRRKPETAR